MLANKTGEFHMIEVITGEIRELAAMTGEYRKLAVLTGEYRKLAVITGEICMLALLSLCMRSDSYLLRICIGRSTADLTNGVCANTE